MGNSNSFESADDSLRLDTSIVDNEDSFSGFGESDPVVTSPTGDRRSRLEARQQLRDHLFGSGADELHSPRKSQQQIRDKPAHAVIANSNPELHSLPSPNPKYPSVDLETAIAILQELRKTATTEDLIALQKALLPARSDDQTYIQALRGTAEPVDPAIAGLIRRRSFFTPGLATRETYPSVMLNPPTPKAAPHQAVGGQQWNPDMFGSSPLSTLVLLDPRGYHPEVHHPRSETPINLDYARIGHRLGDLRVINGTASPSPSITSSILPGLRGTAFEGHGRTESDKEIADFVQHSFTPPVSLPGTHVDPVMPTPTSTLDILTRTTNLQVSTLDTRSPSGSPPPSGGHHRHALSRSKTNVSFTSHSSSLDRPSSPGNMYHSESSSNPFSPANSQMVSPRCSIDPLMTSQTNRAPSENRIDVRKVEGTDACTQSLMPSDHLFDQHPPDMAFHRSNGYVARPISNRKLSESSSIYTTATFDSKPLESNSMVEQDSGYGSQSSLPIAAVASGADRIGQTPASAPRLSGIDKNVRQDPADEYVSASIARTMRGLEQIRTSFSTPRMSEEGHRVLTKPSTSLPRPVPEESCPSPEIMRYRSPSRHDLKPITDEQESTSPSTMLEENRSNQKKLQKKRPLSDRSMTTSQIVSDRSFNEIPQVPIDVALKFHQRLISHPSMEHLKCTFFSVSDVQSRETPSSPQSGGNFELRFPSPTPTDEIPSDDERGRKPGRSNCGPAESVLRLFRSKSRKSKSRERNKSRSGTRDKEVDLLGVANFGTVLESLGSSPYDAAAATGPARHAPSGPRGMTHPHHISTIVRSKSMFGMDEKAASQFARHRSRDRLENFGAPKQLPRRSLQASAIKPTPVDIQKLRPRSYDQSLPTQAPPLPKVFRENGLIRPKSFDVPRSRVDVRRTELAPFQPAAFRSNVGGPSGGSRPVATANRASHGVGRPNESSASKFSVDEAPRRSKPDEKPGAAGDYFAQAPSPTVEATEVELHSEKIPGRYRGSARDQLLQAPPQPPAAPQTQTHTMETEDIEKHWAQPVDFWRQRRRSIGEGLLLSRPQLTTLPHTGSAPDIRPSTALLQKEDPRLHLSRSRHNKMQERMPVSDPRAPKSAIQQSPTHNSPIQKHHFTETRTHLSPLSSPLPSPGTPLPQLPHQSNLQPHPTHEHTPLHPAERAHRPPSPAKAPSSSIQARTALFERAANLNTTTPSFSPNPKHHSVSPSPHPHPSSSQQSTSPTRVPDAIPYHQQWPTTLQARREQHSVPRPSRVYKQQQEQQQREYLAAQRGVDGGRGGIGRVEVKQQAGLLLDLRDVPGLLRRDAS